MVSPMFFLCKCDIPSNFMLGLNCDLNCAYDSVYAQHVDAFVQREYREERSASETGDMQMTSCYPRHKTYMPFRTAVLMW